MATPASLLAAIAGLLFSRLLQHWLMRRPLAHSRFGRQAPDRTDPGSLRGDWLRVSGGSAGAGCRHRSVGLQQDGRRGGRGRGSGLRKIFSDFIGGLIAMLEQPVKVGDRIEVAGIGGR
jgi:hypothetical protein